MTENKKRGRSPARRDRELPVASRRRRGGASHESHSIWEKPKIKAMLKEPVGAPVILTRAEAMAIADEAFGSRPDLPPGTEYVRSIKHIWRGLLRSRRGRRSA